MPALPSPAAPILAVLLVGAASGSLAGCGTASVDPATLKTQLTAVADAVDRCVAKTNDARKCAAPAALGALPGGAELGSGVGQIDIQATRPLRYALVADAGEEQRFSVVAAPVGARQRVCLPAGRGACPEGGAW